MCVCARAHACACAYAYVCVHECMPAHACVCMYVLTCGYPCVYSIFLNFCLFTLTVASDVQFGVLNHLSKIPGGLKGGIPLVMFDKSTRDTIVISPSDTFMDASQAIWTTSKGERVIGFGPLGSIKKVLSYLYDIICMVCSTFHVCT